MSSPKPSNASNIETGSPSALTSAISGSPIPEQESSAIDPADPPLTRPSRPAFTSFFTLLQDVHTSEHYHPTTHYIFSDDSADLVTAASLRTLDPSLPSQSSSLEGSGKASRTASENENIEDENRSSVLPPRRPGVEERYLLLDMDESGEHVVNARSFTSDWQVLNVNITNAPTWAGDEGQGTSGGGGLMLRIEGAGGLDDAEKSLKNTQEASVESLLGDFEKRMAVLRKVVGDIEGGDNHNQIDPEP